jgi:hypothetical protein
MTIFPPTPCIVLTECAGALDWLGHFPDFASAQGAMSDWLGSVDRDEDDVAFIVPALAFGHAAKSEG